MDYFTTFSNTVPALNLGFFDAGILISLPIARVRPLRTARLATPKYSNQ